MIILLIICIVLVLFLVLLLHEISRITKDLDYINQNNTNGNVTTSSNLKIIKRLSKAINLNLEAKNRLRENQEKQNKQFNRMLTNLTHDIKTPLTVSMGYVQLLTQKDSVPENKELIRVKNNLDSVNYYLHYLMDFNLIQEKSKKLNPKQFNLSDTLQNELFNYYDQLSAHLIKAHIQIEPNIIVKSDEMMFRRIFQNLIGNILKYASDNMTVSLFKSEQIIQIIFHNQTDENLTDSNQLLNRFYTADSSRNNQSIGLGLSIVQSLVTTLGGKVKLDTRPNNFQITLIFKHL
ncbi:sensor histidine kinase [Companilactobacillus sp. HBUAS59544]|uniref:sensor histidine kinase n=1 Tax=Companilactobacillus sp. HBUAS59544 TaxID=3109363 RepID=UPI002FF34428